MIIEKKKNKYEKRRGDKVLLRKKLEIGVENKGEKEINMDKVWFIEIGDKGKNLKEDKIDKKIK